MKKTIAAAPEAVESTNQEVHPLMKSYTFVSKGHVDYNDLTAFEAVSLSLVFLLSITAGVVMTIA